MSLEHIEVFLEKISETSETGHEGFPENWVIWHGMTHNTYSYFIGGRRRNTSLRPTSVCNYIPAPLSNSHYTSATWSFSGIDDVIENGRGISINRSLMIIIIIRSCWKFSAVFLITFVGASRAWHAEKKKRLVSISNIGIAKTNYFP